MKHYYIKRGEFANVYTLEYTTSAEQDAAAVAAGYERITRREAFALCARERDRRQYDGAFSGFADSQVWPFGVDRERAMQLPGYMRGYIVE